MKGAPDHLQTTWVWIGVSYLAEQPLCCDLLKVSLHDPLDSPATGRASQTVRKRERAAAGCMRKPTLAIDGHDLKGPTEMTAPAPPPPPENGCVRYQNGPRGRFGGRAGDPSSTAVSKFVPVGLKPNDAMVYLQWFRPQPIYRARAKS